MKQDGMRKREYEEDEMIAKASGTSAQEQAAKVKAARVAVDVAEGVARKVEAQAVQAKKSYKAARAAYRAAKRAAKKAAKRAKRARKALAELVRVAGKKPKAKRAGGSHRAKPVTKSRTKVVAV